MRNDKKPVLIVGAGTVGSSVAEYLSVEGYRVVLIDSNRAVLDSAENRMDVHTIQGEAGDTSVLYESGVEKASLVLAVTNNDAENMICAMASKQLGANQTVARVRNRVFSERRHFDYREALGIDLMICPEFITASEVVKFLDNPDMLAMEHFARGQVQLLQVQIPNGSFLCEQSLMNVDLPEGLLVVMLTRGSEVIIPKGSDRIQPGDRVVFIGLPERIASLRRAMNPDLPKPKLITIAGGGETGLFLARVLERKNYQVKLIEQDRTRCQQISEQLDRTTVLHGDALNRSFLQEEQIGLSDAFVATMAHDENNIMANLLAKRLGAKKTVVLLERPDFAETVQDIGIDVVLNPRELTSQRLLKLIRRGHLNAISFLEEGKVEIMEMHLASDAKVVNKTIKDIGLPNGVLLCSIVRDGKALIPRGLDVMQSDDIFVVACMASQTDEVFRIFQGPIRG